jgi:hypothetical protein
MGMVTGKTATKLSRNEAEYGRKKNIPAIP